jgi:hypothetical protein
MPLRSRSDGWRRSRSDRVMGKTLRGPIRRLHGRRDVEYYRLDNGEPAARQWALRGRILVGGRILDAKDAEGLRSKYGVTHVLSAESEQSDEASWLDPTTRARFAFPDDSQPIAPDICRGAVAYARRVLALPTAVLYCHCRLGRSRGPSMAYMALRILGSSPADALAHCGRSRLSPVPLAPAYLRSIEQALSER